MSTMRIAQPSYATYQTMYSSIAKRLYVSRTKIPTTSNSKVLSNVKPILEKHLFPGAAVNIGGFGLGGIPETLIHELEHYDKAKDLTIASLTAGIDGFGLGKLFEVEGKVKRVLASYVGENKVRHDKMRQNTLLSVQLSASRKLRLFSDYSPCVRTLKKCFSAVN